MLDKIDQRAGWEQKEGKYQTESEGSFSSLAYCVSPTHSPEGRNRFCSRNVRYFTFWTLEHGYMTKREWLQVWCIIVIIP